MRRAPLILCLLLFACTPQATQSISSTPQLTPYWTITPSATPPQPEGLVLSIETPLPSPTPFTYVVQQNDTMSEIAEKYNVSLDDLMAANPAIAPNSMSVGQILLIPSNPSNPGNASIPTPVAVPITQINCYPTTDRGMWCFALVHNDSLDFMENVSAQMTLIDSNSAVISSQTAFLPLNILPPGTSLPLFVFFVPEVPDNAKAHVLLLTAVQLASNDSRYLPATINNSSVQINRSSHTAQVSGRINLPAESTPATQVWVAAVAYDEYGRVVGVKRWEGGGIQPGGSLEFNFMVASAGSAIDAVEVAVEARP